MTIKAVYFDFGGVIARTEFQAPRQHLAERMGMEYEDLDRMVFESETARHASLGTILEEQHWSAVMQRLRLPDSQAGTFQEEFFAGDVIDRSLLDLMRKLRGTLKVGLISNAWSGLRRWIIDRQIDDAFDEMIFSAEVGAVKPDARIFQIALDKFGVLPTQAVFLDDQLANVEGARAVGLQAIHFVQPDKAVEELQLLLTSHR